MVWFTILFQMIGEKTWYSKSLVNKIILYQRQFCMKMIIILSKFCFEKQTVRPKFW